MVQNGQIGPKSRKNGQKLGKNGYFRPKIDILINFLSKIAKKIPVVKKINFCDKILGKCV